MLIDPKYDVYNLAGGVELPGAPKGIDRFVISPGNRLIAGFDCIIAVCVLTTAIVTPLEVAYRTTEDGTATPGDDFTPEDSTVTIPAETTSFEIPPIDIVSDELYEGDETITLEIDDPLRVELASVASPFASSTRSGSSISRVIVSSPS